MAAGREVEDLLLRVGERLGRSKEQMAPFVSRIVEENWLETRESLRRLSSEGWRQLELPLRLEEALKEELGVVSVSLKGGQEDALAQSAKPSRESSLAWPTASSPREGPLPPEATAAPSALKEEGLDFSFDATTDPPESVFTVSAEAAVESLHKEVQGPSLKAALSVLAQLLVGVLANPSSERKRRVRLANAAFHQNVGRLPAAVSVLEAAGFAHEEFNGEATLVLRAAYSLRLVRIYHLLRELGLLVGAEVPALPPKYFDAFSPNITACSGQRLPAAALEARRLENQNIAEQLAERETLLRNGLPAEPVALNPRVFTLECMRLMDSQQQRRPREGEEDFSNVPDEGLGLTAADIQRIKDIMGDGPSFKSRQTQLLEQLKKRAVFSQCCCRILLPGSLVLQLDFSASTKMHVVEEKVSEFLNKAFAPCQAKQEEGLGGEGLRWYLCETPPLRRFSPQKTLQQEGLAPKCLLHLKLEDSSLKPPEFPLDKDTLNRLGLTVQEAKRSESSASSARREAGSRGENSSSSRRDAAENAVRPSPNTKTPSSKGGGARRTLSSLLGNKCPKLNRK